MKRFIRIIAMLTVLATMVVMPVWAEAANSRASSFFGSSNVYLYKLSGTQFEVWFNVTATGGMDELGASEIKIQRSSDGENWSTMRTYIKEVYSNMTDTNTSNHASYFTYTGTAGYYYRAKITLYAKNDEGTGYLERYTAKIKL